MKGAWVKFQPLLFFLENCACALHNQNNHSGGPNFLLPGIHAFPGGDSILYTKPTLAGVPFGLPKIRVLNAGDTAGTPTGTSTGNSVSKYVS